MKKIIYVLTALSLVVLGALGITRASALTERTTVPMQFTWAEQLGVELSSAALTISDLAPGAYKESNAISISVTTNYYGGYTLSASAGNSTNTTSSLKNSTNASAVFTSVATNASVALSGITKGYWGYATSTNGGTSYSNYSGLPYGYDNSGSQVGSTKSIGSTSGAAGTATTYFKIGAYAADDQLSGDYTNTINFYVVTNN